MSTIKIGKRRVSVMDLREQPEVRPAFGCWLLNQRDRDDPVGDLARDADADPEFPRTGGLKRVSTYLILRCCVAAQQALHEATQEWLAVKP